MSHPPTSVKLGATAASYRRIKVPPVVAEISIVSVAGVHTVMATHQDRILAYLRTQPVGVDDDLLATGLGIAPRQTVSSICRRLAVAGRIVRTSAPGTGKIINQLLAPPADTLAPLAFGTLAPVPVIPPGTLVPLATAAAIRQFVYPGEVLLSEDQVKAAVAAVLEETGWTVQVQWGHAPGIDIVARRGSDRWVLEAKGEGSRPQMRVNYFLGALGELLQRMDSPTPAYGLALPAHRQFAGLILRLPAWMRRHLALHFFLVRPTPDGGYVVGVISAGDALPVALPDTG